MSHKFPEYDNLQLSGVNKKVLEQWQEEDLLIDARQLEVVVLGVHFPLMFR